MKKKDIIQLVKKAIKENTFYGNREQPSTLGSTTAVVPTDEYPFSRRPKRTGTGMMEAGPSNNPYYNNLVKKAEEMGIHVNDLIKSLLKDKSEMEIVKMGYQDVAALAGVEDLSEEGESWGLEPRQLADSFTFEELEQLYNDNKISKEDLNGAKSYLQAWIDMHPTYLPQRDLTEPKRQRIRDKYLSEEMKKNYGTKISPEEFKSKMPVGKTVLYSGTRYKVLENTGYVLTLQSLESKKTLKVNLNQFISQGAIKEKTMTKLKNPKKADLNKDGKLSSYEKTRGSAIEKNLDEDITDDIGGAEKAVADATQAKADAESKLADLRKKKADTAKSALEESLLKQYIKKRGNSNLMEHMDRHKKRAVLMEGAMKRLFVMFDQGMTDEEVVQDHATKGVQVPEAFISKIRKQWENLKKAELELEMGEKEFKNAARDIVNNPDEAGTVGMEPGMEEKQLSSGLTN